MIVTRETYEQGTGKLLYTEDVEVPDTVPSQDERIAALEAEVAKYK